MKMNRWRLSLLAGIILTLNLHSLFGATFFAAGRGTTNNGTVWVYDGKEWKIHSVIDECSEIFCLLVDSKGDLWAGGNYYGYGTVWRYRNGRWGKFRLNQGTAVYTLTEDNSGNIVAGGAGEKNIWTYNGNKWDEGVWLEGCRQVFCVVAGKGKELWAGGEGKYNLWHFDGEKWTKGRLMDAEDVFNFYKDKDGTIWAGGRGGRVLWWCKDGEWSKGIIFMDATELSAFTQDNKGTLYACGAGRSKVWVHKQALEWEGVDLPNCIALYSIASDDIVVAGGWNTSRRGGVWVYRNGSWDKGTDLPECYVIRSVVVKK